MWRIESRLHNQRPNTNLLHTRYPCWVKRVTFMAFFSAPPTTGRPKRPAYSVILATGNRWHERCPRSLRHFCDVRVMSASTR
jgi:hypothetical protein